MLKDGDLIYHEVFCGLPHTKVILNSDGWVSQCCYQLKPLGNVLRENKTVMDIWNSELSKEIRQVTSRGELHSHCTSWNQCPFLVKEKFPVLFQTYKDFKHPTYLEICLPDTHCNIGSTDPSDEHPACIMCIRNHRKPKQKDTTRLLCEKSKELMPYLRHLCVLGIAEPFWKDLVFDVFGWLGFAEFRHQIEFETNTNATLLVPKINQRFFNEVSISNISFSLDAATSDTFRKIRRIDAYDNILRNIKSFMAMREDFGGKEKHRTCIWNNINLLNVHEMCAMVETAAELGVDKVIMLPTHDQNGLVHLGELLLNSKNVDLFQEHSEKAMNLAIELGVTLQYPNPFDKVPPPVGQAIQSNQLVQLKT